MTVGCKLLAALRRQGNYFLLALAFFTRIPIPASTPFSAERLNHASRYFSAIGLLVGLWGAGVWLLAQSLLPLSVAVLISMAATIKITGAFHEDGLADMSDGLGGGMDTARKLEIMKDSRLGTYGAITLLLAVLIKYVSLLEISRLSLIEGLLALIVLHATSRALAGSLIFDMHYVRDDSGKAKPLAQNQSPTDLLVLLFFGALPLLLLDIYSALILLVIFIVLRYWIKRWLTRQLGGYTGDCLGAAQQISEVVGYLIWLSLQQLQIIRINPLIDSLLFS